MFGASKYRKKYGYSVKTVKSHLNPEVRKWFASFVPLLCVSTSDRVWNKHHGYKMRLKQTPLWEHHSSPWTFRRLELNLSAQIDKKKKTFKRLGVFTLPYSRCYLDNMTSSHACEENLIVRLLFTAQQSKTIH